jgi:hypothetical protein
MAGQRLATHILPNAASMIGVCVTAVGLVKLLEGRIGPSHVDEYCAIAALIFLACAILSYIALRRGDGDRLSLLLERIADACFMLGLVALTGIALLFDALLRFMARIHGL